MEKSISKAFSTEIKYNLFSNTSIISKLVVNHLDYLSTSNGYNTTVGFLLLDGLTPGKNILWNIDLIKRISGNIEMNIQYEGRSTSLHKMINIGRASIRAIF